MFHRHSPDEQLKAGRFYFLTLEYCISGFHNSHRKIRKDTLLCNGACHAPMINPYGRSKLMIEQILADFASAYGLNYVVLRYFNAAGAHESGEIGEDHKPETHLIPIVLQHLLGQREKISVFGTDYDTPDGTCIRDYIHVTDLAKAHILALEALLSGKKKTAIYNLGNGLGYSVKDVIETCEKVTGRKAVIEYTDRRPGDPARLVASSQKIYEELGWKAEYSLDEIIASAWKWHSRNAE